MPKIYAELIVAGRKTFTQVPEQIKGDVKDVLHGYVVEGRLTLEQYEELVGESYDEELVGESYEGDKNN